MLSRSPSSVTLNSCSFSSGDSLDHCLSVKSLGYMPLRYRQQVSPHIPSMVPFASFWTRSKGAATRGVPTSYAANPLKKSIAPGDEPPPVWPFAEGSVRGYAFLPLHKNVPKAAL